MANIQSRGEYLIHDEEWLKEIWSTRTTDDHNCGPDDCKAYHEHMMRWRPLYENPDDGELVQIVGKITMRVGGEKRIVSHIKEFNLTSGFAAVDIEYLGWRPVPIGDIEHITKEGK